MRILALVFLACAGCFQAEEDDILRTVPVTNNPHIVPGHGSSGVPGLGGSSSSPY